MKRPAKCEYLTPPGGQFCLLRFPGRFNNEPVTWDACIMTLEEAYARTVSKYNFDTAPSVEMRQSLLIGAQTENGRELTIVLDVPCIDEPTIFKTIVMIHNYKRLRLGRHEYGPPRTLPCKD